MSDRVNRLQAQLAAVLQGQASAKADGQNVSNSREGAQRYEIADRAPNLQHAVCDRPRAPSSRRQPSTTHVDWGKIAPLAEKPRKLDQKTQIEESLSSPGMKHESNSEANVSGDDLH
ncbi:MAG: hypothetical protein MHM6MM_002106 [Cercozoa sp. M6MM]